MIFKKIDQAIGSNNSYNLFFLINYRDIHKQGIINMFDDGIDICIFMYDIGMFITEFSSIFIEKSLFISSSEIFDHGFCIDLLNKEFDNIFYRNFSYKFLLCSNDYTCTYIFLSEFFEYCLCSIMLL